MWLEFPQFFHKSIHIWGPAGDVNDELGEMTESTIGLFRLQAQVMRNLILQLNYGAD
jgi:hypothetical protein